MGEYGVIGREGASDRYSPAAKYLYRSIFKKNRHLRFGVFTDIWSMVGGGWSNPYPLPPITHISPLIRGYYIEDDQLIVILLIGVSAMIGTLKFFTGGTYT